jgi:hypothetical protein
MIDRDSVSGRGKIFFFSIFEAPSLLSNANRGLYPGSKAEKLEDDQCLKLVLGLKMMDLYLHSSICHCVIALNYIIKYRVNFIYFFPTLK